MGLSHKARKLLVNFRELGNAGDLHPHDMERWRQFVIQAHNDRDEIQDTDVSEILGETWDSDVAVRLGGKYYDDRLLLGDYDQSRQPS
jgi:hypothetical protein